MTRSTRHRADYELVEPDASAMMESLRAFGYSTPAAIADLVDNSITAGAKNVWITFLWDGPNSHVSFLDDGCGMTGEELTQAMRAGSRSPLEDREASDLETIPFQVGASHSHLIPCDWYCTRFQRGCDNAAEDATGL